MRQHAVAALITFALSCSAYGADGPVKTSDAPASYDWTGFYAGAQLDYQAGQSRWSANRFGALDGAGVFDVGKGYDFSSGTGSYAIGFQGRYDYMDARQHVFGVEGDIWFPNTLSGNQTLTSAALGSVNYSETVQFSGTLRARLGYAADNWLLYLTGGFAWSFDQFGRTQISAAPNGSIPPGAGESQSLIPRYGGAVGAGANIALNDTWSARIEYLFIDYANRGIGFPGAAERFDSSLALQTIRVGLDYKLGEKAIDRDIFTKNMTALELDRFAFHGQTTFIEQYAAPFRSPYIGPQSLSPNQGRESLDFMYFIGAKLWKDAEFWIDPEFNQGFGLSNTKGIAGFPSGAAFKVGSTVPYARIQRAFLRQTIDLGGKTEKVEADQNQFAVSNTADRLVVTVGKFSISDVFDQNKYAQNPRKDFMNWALIDTGSYDYAADAWGYTYGAAGRMVSGTLDCARRRVRRLCAAGQRRSGYDVQTIPARWRNRTPLQALGSPRKNCSDRLSHPCQARHLPGCDSVGASDRNAGRHRRCPRIPQPLRPEHESRAGSDGRPGHLRACGIRKRQCRARFLH